MRVACEVSIVVPVYGCANCLVKLHERLCAALASVSNWELICVDDQSPDGAWQVLDSLARRDHRVRAIRLSRNFGQHAAITAGLAQSHGSWTVVMDCDLQDPPETIPELLAKARQGYDIVLTRRDRPRQSWRRRAGGRAYFALRGILLPTKAHAGYSTMSVLSRPVVEAFLQVNDRDRHYIFILHWLGFNRAVIQMPHAPRYEGESSYTFRKLVSVAIDGMFFQTTVLLKSVIFVGFAVAGCGVLLAVLLFILYFTSHTLPGYTSLAVLILLVGGFMIVSTGVASLYIGKIFEQVKGRPLYVVDARTAYHESREEPSSGVRSRQDASDLVIGRVLDG